MTRAGPRAKKKYLQVACTSLLTCYFLGERTLSSFRGFIYSDLHGTVVVHDRYQNYDSFDSISHQLCTQHLLRDLQDAAECYPDAIWPAQIARELRALIHAANVARDKGLAAVPDEMTAGHLRNQAERDLRPAKTQQKISGRLRSETTTRHRYAIRGYASTARKHSIDVFTAIKDALAGNPWIPPIPAMA